MLEGISEFKALTSKACPDTDEMSLWEMTVHQIKIKNSIDGLYYNLIQDIVNEYIKKLKDEEVINIWKETESGMNRNFEPEDLPTDSLKLDLEEEIMDEITTIAWSEIDNHTLH